MVILLVRVLKDLAPRVFADRHSNGTSPESGFDMYFSASLHFEWSVSLSEGGCSHEHAFLVCKAEINEPRLGLDSVKIVLRIINMFVISELVLSPFRAAVNEYVEGSIFSNQPTKKKRKKGNCLEF